MSSGTGESPHMPPTESARRLSVLGFIGLVLAAPILGCGADSVPRQSSTRTAIGQPRSLFSDTLRAAIAGDEGDLWLAVAGRPNPKRPELTLRVLHRTRERAWSEERPVTRRMQDGPLLYMTVHRGAPCVAFAQARLAVVRCLQRRSWRLRFSRPKQEFDRYISDLRSEHGRLLAIERRGIDSRVDYQVWSIEARARRVGPPIGVRGWVSLGTRDTPGVILGRESFERDGVQRDVLALRDGSWVSVASRLSGYPSGPVLTGPVLRDGVIHESITVGSGEWPFRVFAYKTEWNSASKAPLNRLGRAQGGTFGLGPETWALWQESSERSSGRFDSAVFASRVVEGSIQEQAVHRLWAAPTIGPGDLGMTRALGGIWALSMRAPGDNGPALVPFVSRVDPQAEHAAQGP
jgi:hypothetical protein